MKARELKGLYLVVDASLPEKSLMPILQKALNGGVDILQIWGKWRERREAVAMGRRILSLARPRGVPVLVNNDLELAKEIGADGVHFDDPKITPKEAKMRLKGGIIGVTCGNDLERARWAAENGADYISFCSIFPSMSAGECEIVSLETVKRARKMLGIPIFASGGIDHSNVMQVLEAGVHGVAVISAIMKAADLEDSARRFKVAMNAASKAPKTGALTSSC